MEILNKVMEYINKYNIELVEFNGIKLNVLIALVIIIFLIFLIKTLIYIVRSSKEKNYKGKVRATFVSATMYDEKLKKKTKRGLVRYIINDKPIIKRMHIPKNYRNTGELIVRYDINKPINAIVDTDKTSLLKFTKFLILSIVCVVIVIYIIKI